MNSQLTNKNDKSLNSFNTSSDLDGPFAKAMSINHDHDDGHSSQSMPKHSMRPNVPEFDDSQMDTGSDDHDASADSDDDNNLVGRIVPRYVDVAHGKKVLNTLAPEKNYDGTPFYNRSHYIHKTLKFNGSKYVFSGLSDTSKAINQFIGGKTQFFDVGMKKATDSSQPSKFNRILIQYEDLQNNDKVVAYQHAQSDHAGARFDITPFEANVPDGYVLSKSKPLVDGRHVTEYKPGYQVVRVGVVPKKSVSTVSIIVNYVNNNQTVKVIQTDQKPVGTPFDYHKYQYVLPDGYAFHGFGPGAPTTFSADDNVLTVNVQPNVINMTVNYVNGGKPVGDPVHVSGKYKQPFNVTPYEQNIPNGYRFVNLQSAVPKVFDGHHRINIAVKPIPTKVKISVKYIDVQNHRQVGQASIEGLRGHKFTKATLARYLKAPHGYQNPRVQGPVPSIYQPGQYLVVGVKPVVAKSASDAAQPQGPTHTAPNQGHHKLSAYLDRLDKMKAQAIQAHQAHNTQSKDGFKRPNHVTQDGQIVLKYVNSNGQSVRHNTVLTGPIGGAFDLDQYKLSLPNKQNFVKVLSGSDVKQFRNEKQSIIIEVATHKPSKSSQCGYIIINYLDDMTNKLVGHSEVFNGQINSPFNLSKQKTNVPRGYQFNGVVSGDNVNKYTSVPQIVTFNVHKIGEPNRNAHRVPMNLYYINQSDGSILTHETIYGDRGDPLPLQRYRTGAPQGYRVLNVGTTHNVNTFTKHGAVIVNVARDVHDLHNVMHTNSNPSHNNFSRQTRVSPANYGLNKSGFGSLMTPRPNSMKQMSQQDQDVSAILVALGSSISALGYALSHRRRFDDHHYKH